jgi:hypothetical protein
MDSVITARAFTAGDFLGVLKRVGLRDDAPALALGGIAIAQLGDFATQAWLGPLPQAPTRSPRRCPKWSLSLRRPFH